MREAVDELDQEALRELLRGIIDIPNGRTLLGESMGGSGRSSPIEGVPPDQPGLQAALLADVAALGEAAPASHALSSWLSSTNAEAMSPALLRSVESVEELGALRLSLRQLQYAQSVQRRALEAQNRDAWARASEALRAHRPTAAMDREWQEDLQD